MKQITCAQMGGPATCTFVITGNTAEETVQNGMKHVEEAHPEQAAKIKSNPAEQNAQWMLEFQKKFDALPEM